MKRSLNEDVRRIIVFTMMLSDNDIKNQNRCPQARQTDGQIGIMEGF